MSIEKQINQRIEDYDKTCILLGGLGKYAVVPKIEEWTWSGKPLERVRFVDHCKEETIPFWEDAMSIVDFAESLIMEAPYEICLTSPSPYIREFKVWRSNKP